jgi:phage shock protein PspC (stress-responsive transcriptional regulator)
MAGPQLHASHHGVTRQARGRIVGGVCAGLARRLGLDVAAVRFVVLVLVVAGGVGVIAYGIAWAVLPLDAEVPPPGRSSRLDSVAVILMGLGAMLMLRSVGLWFDDAVGSVGIVAAAGVSLVWGGADGAESLGRGGALRIALGVLLSIAGLGALVALVGDWGTLGRASLGAVLAAAGVAFMLGPTLSRLAGELGAERQARLRSEERAEIAAHLHDGVLQTLALIQRRADDPRAVVALARHQERELRQWLQGGLGHDDATLAGALRRELAEVEEAHGVIVELVCVGDREADDRTRAVVAAAREAVTNAARHASVERIDVYAEVEGDSVQVFVRDRGVGFDPASVGADRRGLAESVVGRMQRAGGWARIRSAPDEGTEVRLGIGGEPPDASPHAPGAHGDASDPAETSSRGGAA